MADISDKAALRERLMAARSLLSPEERLRMANRVEEALFELDEVRAAATIALFSSFGSEIPTDGIATRVLREGRRLLLPLMAANGIEMAVVVPGAELVSTGSGPLEPPNLDPVDPAEIDVVVVPGLAFDRRGGRLGYGGGHYDRYLAAMGPRAVRVGVAFSLQIVDRLPVEDVDRPVDVVVTDAGVIDARGGTGSRR